MSLTPANVAVLQPFHVACSISSYFTSLHILLRSPVVLPNLVALVQRQAEMLGPMLPPELWIEISQYLDAAELYKMGRLNRLFFDLAMDERYREMALTDVQIPQVLGKVEALNNAVVAARVQAMTVCPSVLWDAINTPSKPLLILKKWQSLLSRTKTRVRLSSKAVSAPPIEDAPPETHLSADEKALCVSRAAVNLINVKTLRICCKVNDHYSSCPFLTTFLPALGSNLRTLALDMPPVTLSTFISSISSNDIPNVQELRIHSMVEELNPSAFARIPPANIPSFINELSGTLRSLSITTNGHLEMSAFFSGLRHFPHLIELSIYTALDSIRTADTLGINRFLVNHSGLRKLVIEDQRCVYLDFRPATSDAILDWQSRCLEGTSFTTLEDIVLASGISFSLGVSLRTDLISLSTQTITSLTIRQRCLNFREAKNLLTCLSSSQIKYLSLFVERMNPRLLRLLAKNCPHLHSLVLTVKFISLVDSSDVNNEQFPQSSAEKFYHAWELHDLDIQTWDYGIGRIRQWHFMKAIASSVPSIRSFASWGHM